ncbi:MAG: CHAP domain-containing protein [Candidatus Gastranaerophilales bacterium]|nr:CHAP domain-containing protein [Candidatus Gastranaerophilales bacterium]
MDFKAYIQKMASMQGLTGSASKGLTSSTGNSEMLNALSMFSSAGLEDLQGLDWAKLLSDLKSGSDGAELSGDDQALAGIVEELMSIDEVQAAADADGDGELNEEELANFVQSMMAADGDESNFTYEDIDKALEKMGINLDDVAEKAIEEALDENKDVKKDEEEEKVKDTEKAEKADKTNKAEKATGASPASAPSGSSGSGGASGNYGGGGSNPVQQKKVTAADELEELEKQRKEIISEADKNIETKEKEKDDLVNNNDKISEDLKKEYNTAKDEAKKAEDTVNKTEQSISDNESKLSGIECNISALEGEKSSLKTDTDDKDINKQNQDRLSEIESKLSKQQEEKSKLEEKISQDKQNLEQYKQTQEEKAQALAEVEKKLAEADPQLKTKLEKVNKELGDLKTQKTNDVAEIDKKIETKRKEAKSEAKEAGVNKGKAANDIGSGLVALAEKYMGKNEADGSYKMFTNGRAEAWCADFVTYIVKEYAQQQGLSIKDGFGSPAVANLMSWAQQNNCFTSVSDMGGDARQKLLQNDLHPGDVIIWKSAGASHTGIIRSINSDGTFETVEGNSSDQVKSNHKSVKDASLTGFIKFSDIVK